MHANLHDLIANQRASTESAQKRDIESVVHYLSQPARTRRRSPSRCCNEISSKPVVINGRYCKGDWNLNAVVKEYANSYFFDRGIDLAVALKDPSLINKCLDVG